MAYQRYLRAASSRVLQYPPALTDWERRNPHIAEAYLVMNQAIRLGWLKRQPCETCGNPRSEAHHDDYDKPLVVRWLCHTHHRRHHASLRKRNG